MALTAPNPQRYTISNSFTLISVILLLLDTAPAELVPAMAQQGYSGPNPLQHAHQTGRGMGLLPPPTLAHNIPQPHPSHGYPAGPPAVHMKSGGPNFGGPHYPTGQQPITLGDLSLAALEDLVPRITSLGFPKSCSFVFGLLERYDSEGLLLP